MLSQLEADRLIELVKSLVKNQQILLPSPGNKMQLDAQSHKNEKFIIDIRRGRVKISKASFQTRYKNSIPLIRLDVDGPDHPNPDGEIIPCPHIHIYREGAELKWAYPLKIEGNKDFSDLRDLTQVLIDFLHYNNIDNIPTYIADSLFI
ncbi:hypothetical protein FLT15_16290 [Paenibacillus thiaminolyticus]|uniref:DUF6978 family protein n=1 Tax=Paenibacillus thiaminolyticus TaxID=49283 RepID=UPI0013F5E5E4|nr:hypothetical protein [Paenibacillus thiaminolyticus]NGP59866.1 hypothetical protein [Paenibacillus thiaminolyticus]